MPLLLNFLLDNKNWIYGILLLTGFIYLRRLFSSWNEYQSTIFGLERENAQRRLNTSLAMVILIILLAAAEFVVVNLVMPKLQQAMQNVEAPLNTQIPTQVGTPSTGDLTTTSVPTEPGATQSVSAFASSVQVSTGGCIPGQIEWKSPSPGEEISGTYTLIGTVNVQNFSLYEYAYAPLSDLTNWTEINAASLPIVEGELGVLSTEVIPNGDYDLRLVVTDINNQQLAPCDVAVRILNKGQ